jgi:regulator of protease activity HflC (stomatin/prohibitin superfamily)
MPAGQFLSFVDTVPSPWNTVIKLLLAIAGGVYLFMKTFKYVPEGHEALRLRFQTVVQRDGKPVVAKKGLHVMIPFVNSLQIVNVLDRTINLRSNSLLTGRFQAFSIRTSVVFAVTDIYKLSYGAEEPMPRLKAACENALRDALIAHPLQDGTLEKARVIDAFVASVAEEPTRWTASARPWRRRSAWVPRRQTEKARSNRCCWPALPHRSAGFSNSKCKQSYKISVY